MQYLPQAEPIRGLINMKLASIREGRERKMELMS